MKQIVLALCIVVLVVGTVGAGWLHGRMTNRWGDHPDTKVAAARLRQPLPERVGQWQLRREVELEQAVIRMLQCPASISRVYEHLQTGDAISVAVLLGPPGPISVHTPEICYSSHGYAVTDQREALAVQDAGGSEHSFWQVQMKSNDLHAGRLRVLYGWTTGDRWTASSNPRFGFGGVSHLYKIQLASNSSADESLEEFDPAKDFLNHFLPQLQGRLMDARSPGAGP